MFALGIILLLLLPVVLVVGVVALVVRAARNDGDGDGNVDWGRSIRDLFIHLVAGGLALVAAVGLAQVVELVLQGPGLLRVDEGLAVPVTFTVIGVPLYAGVMWWVLRDLHRSRQRSRSGAWALHLGIIEVVSLVSVMVAAQDLGRWALGDDGRDWTGSAATLVVWGALWGAYRVLRERHGPARWAVVPVLVGSAIGLGTLASGLVQVLESVLESVVFGTDLVVATDQTRYLVVLVVGAVTWTIYWIADGLRRDRDAWWHGWVLLGPVLTGLISMVGAGGFVLFQGLVWLVGDPVTPAREHFQDVPAAVAWAIVAALVWFVHRSLLVARNQRTRREVDRVHDLVLAGVGLLAAAGGLATVLVAMIESAVGPATVSAGDAPVNTLLAALTSLVIGAPLWWRAWSRIQRLAVLAPRKADVAAADPDDPGRAERHSPARRVYLFGLFGFGGLITVLTLLVGVVAVLEDVFSGVAGRETVYDARYGIAAIAVIGAVATYHWTVYRRDQRLGESDPADAAAAARRSHPGRITLVGVADAHVVAALREATGSNVELWQRRDAAVAPWNVPALAEQLAGRTDAHVLVVADRRGVAVMPVDH